MGLLDDTAIFTAIIQQGGFSHAAKYLGLSNGLISRRIAQLEKQLGVTLMIRTTRQVQLTAEGQLFWQHAERIQEEMGSLLCSIKALSEKPKGEIKLSAPVFFGKHILVPICTKFLANFKDITLDINLTSQQVNPLKENLDFIIRGAGYLQQSDLKDSSLKMKLLIKQKIGLYASPNYLQQYGEPKKPGDLIKHRIVGFVDYHRTDHESWAYEYKNKSGVVKGLLPSFKCNEIDGTLAACVNGAGIGKFAELAVQAALRTQTLVPLLEKYYWGDFNLYAIYAQQQQLPKRTRLLLDFIQSHLHSKA